MVGPLTNAPGHRTKQNVNRFIDNFKVDDSSEYIAEVSQRLLEKNLGMTEKGPLNGFCVAALAETWVKGAFNISEGHFFNPKNKMVKNEDELIGRWKKMGITNRIVCSSFVFHYRGVTRFPTGRQAGKGHFRI